jgi:hypothetical protein
LKLKSTTSIDLTVQASNLFHVGFNYITAANLPKPSWKTNRKHKLTRGEWVKRYADELTLLGVSFDKITKYCLLDIDRGSKYHPYNDLKAFKKVCQSLEKVGLLSYDIIRSSESEGIHVYFHLPRAVNTFRLAALIHVTLINAGIDIRDGQLECFPNPKEYGDKEHPTYFKPHRLPLQPNAGGMLLDQNGEILLTAENLTHESMLAGFLRRAEITAANQDIELLERKLNWAYDKYKTEIGKYQYHHQKNYSQTAQEWKENLELTLEIGWTAQHQTNTLLPSYIQYGIVFLGLKGEALANWMYEQITTTRGYREYCRHQHEIKKIIANWVNNTERQDYYLEYCSFPARSGLSPYKVVKHIKSLRNEHNENLSERTKQRITKAVAALTEIPIKIGDRVIAIIAKSKELFGQGISRNTLYKAEYKTIWDLNENEPINSESAKNLTPPLNTVQPITLPQEQSINPEKIDLNSTPQSLSQTALSHTPPIYETFVQQSSTLKLHHYLQLYCIKFICGSILVLFSETNLFNLELIESNLKSLPSSDNLEIISSKSIYPTEDFITPPQVEIESEPVELPTIEEAELEDLSTNSISIGTKLRRNVERVGSKTYPALPNCEVVSSNGLDWVVRDLDGCRWNVSHHAIASGVWEIAQDPIAQAARTLVAVAREIRASIPQVPDELLLEFLNHPACERIQLTIELGDKLVAAQSAEEIRSLTQDLNHADKTELWGVLSEKEREVLRQKFDRVPGSIEDSDRLTGYPAIGSIVCTINGMVGVVRYIFDSIAKPFVVYHDQLQRTIRYELGDLQSFGELI